MRKPLVGLAALGLLFALAVPAAGEAAPAPKKAALKTGEQIEVGSQYRRYRRVAYRPYRAVVYRPYRAVRSYAVYSAPVYGPAVGYYPAWYSPYYDDGYAYGYGSRYYGGYGYGVGYRPFISVGFGGFGLWF